MMNKLFNFSLHALALTLVLGAPTLQAQQVYRIVGADGKITFSDKPPVETNARVVTGTANGGPGGGVSALPFELRQVATKYPVTLYTAANCAPCATARTLLVTRGIPFTEKTVSTQEDSQALQRLSGDASLPFATIGGQQLKGFADSEWTQFLNAAGYPATSTLPASYRAPAATPLVAVVAAPVTAGGPAEAGAPTSRPGTRTPAPAPQPNTNPAGIKF